MPVFADLLAAADCVRKYALTTQMPVPKSTNPKDEGDGEGEEEEGGGDEERNTESQGQMGELYDHWLRIIVRDSSQVEYALSRVTLFSQRSVQANEHMTRMCSDITSRLDRVLNYQNPYGPGNLHGLVLNKATFFNRSAIRQVHRAIAMQYLAIHLMRLQYLTLLTRIDALESGDVFQDQEPVFDKKLERILDDIYQVLTQADCETKNNFLSEADRDKMQKYTRIPYIGSLFQAMEYEAEVDVPPESLRILFEPVSNLNKNQLSQYPQLSSPARDSAYWI